jgi:peptidyl-prolyl cis-trans isomerase SurA
MRHATRAAGCLAVLWLAAMPVAGQQLIERVLARVNGAAITLTDVRTALAFGLVDVPAGGDREAGALERLIDRRLVLAEVARFAPPEPAAADVTREAAVLTATAGRDVESVMASTGIDEGRLREFARDNLRIRAYLDQRFGSTVQLTEDEVERYYRIHPEEFTREGRLAPFAEVEPTVRARAAAERRATIVAQWVRDLRTRATVSLPTP